MGKASRSKRTRAAVRSAKRSRNNNWWYALTALVLIAGIALLVYARETEPDAVGPFVNDPSNPAATDTHWHAALGVYDCDHWVGDGTGDGLWDWPAATQNQAPARVENTNVYAGLHSHADGIIHMEPSTTEDAGNNATLGRYLRYGGWSADTDGFDFVGVEKRNGDSCPDGPGAFQWATARWDGTSPPGQQKYTVQTGNPSDMKLNNGDIVILAYLPEGKTIDSIGNPPGTPNLPNAVNIETRPGEMPAVTAPPATTGTTAPASSTPPTSAPSPSTSTP